jgi:cell division protein FtsQ
MRPLGHDEVGMARLDPQASRLKYRVERLLLTPLVRFCLRVALPAALAFGAGAAWLSSEQNRAALQAAYADLRDRIESRPEFEVTLMAIDGASAGVADDVRAALDLDFPVSSFDLDLARMQARVIALGAVRTAGLRIRQGGVLQVDIEERRPEVLWRSDEGLALLDRGGIRVGMAAGRAAHPGLPVIAGEGAERAVSEAMALHAVAGPLRARLRGYERMGARRWDVVLDRGQRILLPETDAVQAFERAIAMHEAVRMLDRDVVAVDLRLPHRPTLRMTPAATAALREFREIEAGGEKQQ